MTLLGARDPDPVLDIEGPRGAMQLLTYSGQSRFPCQPEGTS